MKYVCVVAVIAAISSIGATALVPGASTQDAESVQWAQLLEHDVSTLVAQAAERGPLAGGSAASAIGFRVSDAIQGGALITLLERPAVGVFVGLNVPNEFINEAYGDLRVVFTLDDESVRTVKPAAGGGTAMLFQSPDDLPMLRIRKLALYVDETASWVRSQ